MAKLDPPFDPIAFDIESLLGEGRQKEARDLLVRLLRAGTASDTVQRIAADLLAPAPKLPGRPQLKYPARWFELGREFEYLVDGGATKAAARTTLAERYSMSESSVRDAVRFYQDAPKD